MSAQKKHLKLVQAPRRDARQLELFSRSALLAVVNLGPATGEVFHGLVRLLRPTVIMDLRPVPRFDFGTLNRVKAFGLFTEAGTTYVDMSGRLGVTSRRDARLNPALLAGEIERVLDALGRSSGPLVLLLDNHDQADATARLLPGQLSQLREGNWRAKVVQNEADLIHAEA
jgi:hypothetical protein